MCPGEVAVEEAVNETDDIVVTGSGTDEDEVGSAEMLELAECWGVFDVGLAFYLKAHYGCIQDKTERYWCYAFFSL